MEENEGLAGSALHPSHSANNLGQAMTLWHHIPMALWHHSHHQGNTTWAGLHMAETMGDH